MKVGEIIPDFTLKNQNNEKFRLYDIKDKMVLLSFHPLAWTGVCAKQMQSLENNFDELSDLGILPVGISVDSDPTKRAWAEELGIEKTQLLADFCPHGGLAKKIGILDEQKGVSKRVNILVAENKEILFMKIYEMSTVPNLDEVTEFVRKERRKGREL
ncbi:MAG: redoxin domain-containing protein [Candidatus Heimdallarchaeota archaeon]|nr:redoxin domain-containing protein [Candidatus Heimdallarchaeota archaeon]MCK4771097.1 redoxin domain-containing protein [Candidatus Heimdallarchaeota archaeon]